LRISWQRESLPLISRHQKIQSCPVVKGDIPKLLEWGKVKKECT